MPEIADPDQEFWILASLAHPSDQVEELVELAAHLKGLAGKAQSKVTQASRASFTKWVEDSLEK